MPKYVVQSGWDDAPHLSPEARAELEGAYPPHERDARIRGIPQLGAGAIYPVPESEIVVHPFELPVLWRRVYALDVGWNRTAAIWGAHDTQSDVIYLYSEHYRSQAEPAIHAEAIRARGKWIPGVIDPAARGRSQADGEALFDQYRTLGLTLTLAENAVDAGLYEVWTRLSSGRLRVFASLGNWLAEYRLYHRDEKGKVVKDNDHLMDATRYLCMSGVSVAAWQPNALKKPTARAEVDYDPQAHWKRDIGIERNPPPEYNPAARWR